MVEDASDPPDDASPRESGGMSEGIARPAAPPDLPAYVVEPLQRQSAERLEAIATYARELAAHRRDVAHRRDAGDEPGGEDPGESSGGGDAMPSKPVGDDQLAALEDRGVSTDASDYDDVPDAGAYVTVKETKPGYRYYYWQWRDGDTWKNQYIAPVDDGG